MLGYGETLPEYTITEGSMYTLLLTVTSASGQKMYYKSLLNLTEFTKTPPVESLSLSNSNVRVTYEPQ